MSSFQARAVILDMDGVLVDSEPLYLKALNRVLVDMGAEPLTDDENRGLIGTTVAHTWEAIMEMRSLPRPTGYYLDRYTQQVSRIIESDMVVAPGVERIIEEVHTRGMPLGLASSSLRKWVDLKLKVTGLARAFDVVFAGDEIERGKPAPDIYLEVARRLDVIPGECLAIEDSPSGVEAAVTAGMYTVAVRTVSTAGLDVSRAHVVLDSLKDFDMGLLGGPKPAPRGDITAEAR